MSNRLNNSTRNFFWGIIGKLVTIMGPFIVRTIMIRCMGANYLGLNSLFASVLNILSLSELGVGSAVIYSMYEPAARNDVKRLSALLHLYKRVYIYIGIVIMVLGTILIPFLPNLINGDTPTDINITLLYCIYLFNTVISYFFFAYKSAILSAFQREDVNSNIITLVTVGMYIIQITMLLCINNYYVYVIWLPASTFVINLMRSKIVDRMYPEISSVGDIDSKEKYNIFKNVFALVGNKINGTIVMASDNLVISAYLGLTTVAIYNNYNYIIIALVGLFSIFYNAIRPSIGNSIAIESKQKNESDFNNVTFIVIWAAGWCSCCLLSLIQPFMKIWMGEDYQLPNGMAAMFALYFFVWKLLDSVIVYRDAAGMWWNDKFRPYIVSILNLILSLWWVNYIGLYGVLLSTIVTMAFISYPWLVHMLYKESFEKSSVGYYKKIIYYIAVILGAVSLTYIVCNLIPENGILFFAFKSFVCLVLPNIVMIASFWNMKEFIYVRNLLNIKLKNLKKKEIILKL